MWTGRGRCEDEVQEEEKLSKKFRDSEGSLRKLSCFDRIEKDFVTNQVVNLSRTVNDIQVLRKHLNFLFP